MREVVDVLLKYWMSGPALTTARLLRLAVVSVFESAALPGGGSDKYPRTPPDAAPC